MQQYWESEVGDRKLDLSLMMRRPSEKEGHHMIKYSNEWLELTSVAGGMIKSIWDRLSLVCYR